MSLATVCRSFWLRVGLGFPVPSNWIGASDQTTLEATEFAHEALRMVAQAHDWEALTQTHTATLAPVAEQTVALPADYGRLVPQTVWITDLAWPVTGPVSEAEYEQLRQPPSAAAWPVFRLAGDVLHLLANPTPAGPLTLRYVSSHFVSNGGTTRRTWENDADVARVDEALVTLAMVYLWRDARGLDARNAAAVYASELARAKAQDVPRGVMTMRGGHAGRAPVGLPNGTTVTPL